MKRTVLSCLYTCAKAAQKSDAKGRPDWSDRHWNRVGALQARYLPSGSGFNSGSFMTNCSDDKITFGTAFQHMNEHGVYTCWSYHTVQVKPGFDGPVISVSGRDRNNIKAYIAEAFLRALAEEIDVQAFCADVDVPE